MVAVNFASLVCVLSELKLSPVENACNFKISIML
jgi:hypothetical protein